MRRSRHYNADPFPTQARFDSKCACGADVKRGDDIFYYPNGRNVKGARCGCADTAQRDFEAIRQDDDFMQGQF